jgi:hypothetical protein
MMPQGNWPVGFQHGLPAGVLTAQAWVLEVILSHANADRFSGRRVVAAGRSVKVVSLPGVVSTQ